MCLKFSKKKKYRQNILSNVINFKFFQWNVWYSSIWCQLWCHYKHTAFIKFYFCCMERAFFLCTLHRAHRFDWPNEAALSYKRRFYKSQNVDGPYEMENILLGSNNMICIPCQNMWEMCECVCEYVSSVYFIFYFLWMCVVCVDVVVSVCINK